MGKINILFKFLKLSFSQVNPFVWKYCILKFQLNKCMINIKVFNVLFVVEWNRNDNLYLANNTREHEMVQTNYQLQILRHDVLPSWCGIFINRSNTSKVIKRVSVRFSDSVCFNRVRFESSQMIIYLWMFQ